MNDITTPPATSRVLEVPPPEPAISAAAMRDKLGLHTDAWDLAQDLANAIETLVVIDTRSRSHYLAGHIPGAISLPHVEMSDTSLAALARDRVYVCYCDGIGCNGSTWGTLKLATAGFTVKELLGGLDFWQRDGHPIASGPEPGSLAAAKLAACGC
ncbi:rhodanese-like domain-containing protein [Salinicola endophyticus]|uniref:rhodanese-like domain-containing protein n=1 Tax=Salinicola endophyticus TaxID=1949083 RepID=UPI000DA16CB1|nr:rhodanese-like domain-containing protein [Salinicola endophyticus]